MSQRPVADMALVWVNIFAHPTDTPIYLSLSPTATGRRQADLASGAQAQLQQPQAGQPQDYHKLFVAEKENLLLAQGLYKWSVEDIDVRVLQKYGKLPKAAAP